MKKKNPSKLYKNISVAVALRCEAFSLRSRKCPVSCALLVPVVLAFSVSILVSFYGLDVACDSWQLRRLAAIFFDLTDLVCIEYRASEIGLGCLAAFD